MKGMKKGQGDFSVIGQKCTLSIFEQISREWREAFLLPRQAGAKEAIPKDGHSIRIEDTEGWRTVFKGQELSQWPYVVLSKHDRKQTCRQFQAGELVSAGP